MRLLTAISVTTLAVSIAALVLVLWLVVTEPWVADEGTYTEKETPLTINPEPTPTVIEPKLTSKLIFGLLEEYGASSKHDGWECLTANPYRTSNMWVRRFPDLVINFEPHYRHINVPTWVIRASGKHCEGVEVFLIGDETGEVTYGHPDEK